MSGKDLQARPLRARIISLAFLSVLAVGCSREPPSLDPQAAYQDGRAEAQKDIANGKIVIKGYGLPVPWSEVYRVNLLSRYQIESRVVGGCSVPKELAENIRGYNEISKAEIERRYGADILSQVAKESAEMWQQRQTNK